jgi:hypothetical protein
LISGQLKGIPQAAVNQFCSRQYTVKNRKILLETKKEFKKKFGHSPDEADAVAVICEVALQRGISPGTVLAGNDNWDKAVQEINSALEEPEYGPEELMGVYYEPELYQ